MGRLRYWLTAVSSTMPDPDYFGSDSFTYQAIDSRGAESLAATVTIAVSEDNNTPAALDDSYATVEDTALVVPAAGGLLDNDSDGDSTDTLSVEVASVTATRPWVGYGTG